MLSLACMTLATATRDVAAEFEHNAKRGRWSISLCGNILQVQQTGCRRRWYDNEGRGPCGPFSAASRRRLIFRLARVAWPDRRHLKFVTLTYPPWEAERSMTQRTQDRTLFARYLEEYLGRKVAIIWRTEWEVRKSGDRVGEPFPHVHMVVFAKEFIPFYYVNYWWHSILGTCYYLRTECKGVRKVSAVGAYVAGYIAFPESVSLVIASYLNRVRGRPWGIMRPKLVPWHQERRIDNVHPDVIVEAWKNASAAYPPIAESCAGGFTVLGKACQVIFKDAEAECIDRPFDGVYTCEYSVGDDGSGRPRTKRDRS